MEGDVKTNLHTFNSPVSNLSIIKGASIEGDFDVFVKNTYSYTLDDKVDYIKSMIMNESMFINILETPEKASDYRWHDLFIWSDTNIWKDKE